MTPQTTKGTACFWLPAFPAWAMAWSHALRAPVAVVQGGKVMSATRGALQHGVRIGMAADRVVDVASRTKVFLRDVSCEHAMWDFVLERLHALTPFLESMEPGVVFLQSVDKDELKGLATELRACVGISPNRRVARLASACAGEGSVFTVSHKRLVSFLRHTSVDVLAKLGFEEELVERLLLFGFPTLSRAATLSEHHLKAQFGSRVGKQLSAYLNPPPEKAIGLFRPPRVATATYIFEWDESLHYQKHFEGVTAQLVEEAHEKLKGWNCRRLVVRLSDEREEHIATRILPKATDRVPYLLRQVRTLARPIVEQATSYGMFKLELRSFSPGESRQGALWRSRPTLENAARKIEPRFPGACVRTVHAPYALLPEDEFCYEPYVVLDEDER